VVMVRKSLGTRKHPEKLRLKAPGVVDFSYFSSSHSIVDYIMLSALILM
jgi:hypothetical protein